MARIAYLTTPNPSNSTSLKGMFKLPLFSDRCFDQMVLCRALIRRMDDPKKATSIYDFTAKDIDGNEVLISQNQTNENLTFFQVSLSKYKGHVCVIVNVASK